MSGFIIGAGAQKEFNLTDLMKSYMAAGIGVTFISADDIVGSSQDGDVFNIATDTGTEFIPYVNGGIRWMVWRNVSLDLGARFEYHLTDWEVTDRVSGLSGRINDYIQSGCFIGVAVSF